MSIRNTVQQAIPSMLGLGLKGSWRAKVEDDGMNKTAY